MSLSAVILIHYTGLSVHQSVCLSVVRSIYVLQYAAISLDSTLESFNLIFYFTIIHSVWYLQVSLAEQFPGDVLITYNAPSVLVCTTLGIIVHSGN